MSWRPLVPVALAFCASVAACPPPEPPRPVPGPAIAEPKTQVPPVRDDGRLPSLAAPLAYRIAWTIDPRKPRFGGTAAIDVEIAAPTSVLVLHGHGLAMREASARTPGGIVRAQTSFRVAHGATSKAAPEELVLEFDKKLPPGRTTLELAWDAPFDDELSGIYRVEHDGAWYAFSQFEATDARRAFPCFDEPAFKTPFEVSVTVPSNMVAFSNTPEAHREPRGGETTFRFAGSKPMPTYLVAIAVGELEVREAKPSSRATTPRIRLVTTKGKTGDGELALEATTAIVEALSDWFAIPYPYEKLDIVAVPAFSGGAMENAGLVTFRDDLLLVDPARASVRTRRAQALVIAHELAHQWFGNLVTAAWWNDLWLNEGMAEWMEARIVDQWKPQWGTRLDALVNALSVMDMDGLSTARAVRQPVTSTSEASEAFDGLTYQKGAAVLSTIEHWVGAPAFQRGVRAYLEKNAWKSVQSEELFVALDRATGKDVSQMAKQFLDKPGVPVVDAALTCERGARWNVELTQEAWRPLGAKITKNADGEEVIDERIWTLPVCIAVQNEKAPLCADLAFGAPSLVAGRGCPTWIFPNASGSYYRYLLPEAKTLEAANAKLDVAQRLVLLSNAWAQVRAGKAKPESMIKLLAAFDGDTTRQVVEAVSTILYGISDALVEDEARPAFRKWVLARFAKRKATFGWQAKAGETSGGDEAYLRRTVLYAMGDLAEDETTLREAEAIATKWLADPASVDADIAAVALELAGRHAGEARVAEIVGAIKTKRVKTGEDRANALRALGAFDDAGALGKSLDIIFTDDVGAHEVRQVLGVALGRRAARGAAEKWTRANWARLRKKLPGGLSKILVRGASATCSKDEVQERATFYGRELADVEGASRPLAEGLESATLCAELRRFGASAFGRALAALDKKK